MHSATCTPVRYHHPEDRKTARCFNRDNRNDGGNGNDRQINRRNSQRELPRKQRREKLTDFCVFMVRPAVLKVVADVFGNFRARLSEDVGLRREVSVNEAVYWHRYGSKYVIEDW